MARPLRVLHVFDIPYTLKRGHDYAAEFKDRENFDAEADVFRALQENGYEARPLGVFDDLRVLLDDIDEFKPDVIFNMVDTFHDVTGWDKNIAALLEMLHVPFTGASSTALFMCNDKGLCRKILRYHRLRGPRFHIYYRGHKVWLPKTMTLPCIVKPLTEEASRGISQASIVDTEKALIDRVDMIHTRMRLDAIAEEYIDGREMYVSIVGDKRLRVLPPREMTFGQMPEDEPRIATYKAKWDVAYRKRWGIRNEFAGKLDADLSERLGDVCKRAYRALNIRSYARFDLRVTASGQIHVIEPNVNPNIAKDDELAQSARKVGIAYPTLIRTIVNQALAKTKT